MGAVVVFGTAQSLQRELQVFGLSQQANNAANMNSQLNAMTPMGYGLQQANALSSIARNAASYQNPAMALQAYNRDLASYYSPSRPPRPGRAEVMALLGEALSEAREKKTLKAWRQYMACFVAVVAEHKPQLNTIQPSKRGFGGGSPKHAWAF